MKKLIYILLLLPCFMFGQAPDLLQASLQQVGNPNPELITTGLALSPPDINTVPDNGVADNNLSPILNGTWAVVSANTSGTGYIKNYALMVSNTSSASDRVQLYLTNLTIGEVYEYIVLVKANGTASYRFGNAVGIEETINHTGTETTWQVYTGEFTPNANPVRLSFYADTGWTTGTTSSDYILSIKLKND